MKLILVRHGETEENVKKINQGQKHGKLTQKGIEQAKKLALRLKDEKIDKIYVSDLQRTIDTAKEIIEYHPQTEVIYEPQIREQCMGVLEGSPHGTIRETARKAGVPKFEYTPEGGESLKELQHRLMNFINKIIETEHNKTILLVTHGGPIMHLMLHLLQKSYEEHEQYHTHNCSLTILEINGKEKKIHVFNCCKHLTPEQ